MAKKNSYLLSNPKEYKAYQREYHIKRNRKLKLERLGLTEEELVAQEQREESAEAKKPLGRLKDVKDRVRRKLPKRKITDPVMYLERESADYSYINKTHKNVWIIEKITHDATKLSSFIVDITFDETYGFNVTKSTGRPIEAKVFHSTGDAGRYYLKYKLNEVGWQVKTVEPSQKRYSRG